MAATGYTPISLYYSTTAAAVPVNTNLVNGELAINITDGKLYYKDNAGVVQLFGSKGDLTTISFGTTGLTPSTATGGAVTVAGTLVTANGGTGLTTFTAANNAIYSTSSSALTAGTLPIAAGGTGATTLAGANIAVTTAANTFTATNTFTGTTAAAAILVTNIDEPATVSATAATGTINFDITTQSILYYTTNASANFTVNFRASSGTALNTLMSTGQAITCSFLVTNGSTAYYNSAVQVDGTTSGVTTKWQGGTAPTSGDASAVDVYNYVIIKTGSAAFTVLASVTKFA